jgi:PAS domain S-box-containing protein
VAKALELSERAADAFLNAIEDLTLLLDKNGVIIHANPAAAEMLQIPVEELVGKNPYDFMPPEIARSRKSRFNEIVLSGRPTKVDDIYNGKSFEITYYPVKGVTGGIEAIAAVIRETTEFVRIKSALRESEDKYRKLIEGLDEVVYRMRLPEGRYEHISPTAKKVFGYSAEEFRSKPLFISQIIHPDFKRQFQKLWADLLKGEVPAVYEYKVIDHAGN